MVGRVTGNKQLFILDLIRSLGFHPRAGCAAIREEWMSAARAMIPCRPCCPDLPNDSPPHVLHCCPLRRRQTRPPRNHATQLPSSILVNPRRWTTAAIRRWTSLKSAVVQRRILFWDVVPAISVGSMFFFHYWSDICRRHNRHRIQPTCSLEQSHSNFFSQLYQDGLDETSRKRSYGGSDVMFNASVTPEMAGHLRSGIQVLNKPLFSLHVHNNSVLWVASVTKR